jgi:hypothetical protein
MMLFTEVFSFFCGARKRGDWRWFEGVRANGTAPQGRSKTKGWGGPAAHEDKQSEKVSSRGGRTGGLGLGSRAGPWPLLYAPSPPPPGHACAPAGGTCRSGRWSRAWRPFWGFGWEPEGAGGADACSGNDTTIRFHGGGLSLSCRRRRGGRAEAAPAGWPRAGHCLELPGPREPIPPPRGKLRGGHTHHNPRLLNPTLVVAKLISLVALDQRRAGGQPPGAVGRLGSTTPHGSRWHSPCKRAVGPPLDRSSPRSALPRGAALWNGEAVAPRPRARAGRGCRGGGGTVVVGTKKPHTPRSPAARPRRPPLAHSSH